MRQSDEMHEVAARSTAILIPCSKTKEGNGLKVERPIEIISFLGQGATVLLKQARQDVLQIPNVTFDETSRLVPAIVLYSGTLYKVEGFLNAIGNALATGLHILIISGGYGLLRAEEPIHKYEAYLGRSDGKLRSFWKRILPGIVADYAERNKIKNVFITGSKPYSDVLGTEGWTIGRTVRWYIPHASEGESPYIAVPKKCGEAIRDLLNGLMSGRELDGRWTLTPTTSDVADDSVDECDDLTGTEHQPQSQPKDPLPPTSSNSRIHAVSLSSAARMLHELGICKAYGPTGKINGPNCQRFGHRRNGRWFWIVEELLREAQRRGSSTKKIEEVTRIIQ